MISSVTLFFAALALHATAVLGAPIRYTPEIVPRSLDSPEWTVRFAREESFPDLLSARAVSDNVAVPIVQRDVEDRVRRFPRRFIYEHLEKRGTTITEKVTVFEKTTKHDTPLDAIAFNNGQPQNSNNNGNGNGNGAGGFTTIIGFSTTITIPGAPTATPTTSVTSATPTPTPTPPPTTDPSAPGNTDPSKPADGNQGDDDTTTDDGTTSNSPTDPNSPTTPPPDSPNPDNNGGGSDDETEGGLADNIDPRATTESRRNMQGDPTSQPIAKRMLAMSGAVWASSLRRRAT